GYHVEAGGLAGAVRSEDADRLAGAHAEADPVHHPAALVGLGQLARHQRPGHVPGRAGGLLRNIRHFLPQLDRGVICMMILLPPDFWRSQPSKRALPERISTVSLQPTMTLSPSDSTTRSPDRTSTSLFMS